MEDVNIGKEGFFDLIVLLFGLGNCKSDMGKVLELVVEVEIELRCLKFFGI